MVGTYFRYRRACDLIFSAALVLAVYFGGYFDIGLFRSMTNETALPLFEGVFQVSAAMLGFVLASVAFLSSHVRQPEFKILRESRVYPQLLALFNSALWRLFALTCFAAVGTVLSATWIALAEKCLLFLVAYAAEAVAGLIWITLRILRVPDHK